MRFCDFFSGIGGFRLGLERAGHKGVWACEIDDFCRKVYAWHFEEPQGKDIRKVKAEEIPEAELWCGGFPCQDLSVAGKRAGLKAKRSGLYWVWHRLIEARQPPWLLIENVPGLLSSHDGGDFRLLLSSLTGCEVPMPRHGRWPYAGLVRRPGVETAWRVLDAQYFGLAQRRARVFIVRYLGEGSSAEVLFEREGLPGDTTPEQEAGREIARTIKTGTDKGDLAIAHSLTRRHDGSAGAGGGNPLVVGASAIRNQGANLGAEASSYIIKGAAIGRKPEAGPQRGEICKGTSYALNTREVHAVAFAENQRGEICTSDISPQLSTGGGKPGQGYSAVLAPSPRAHAIYKERGSKQLDAEGEMVRAGDRDVRAGTPPDPNGVREATGLPGRMDTPDSPRYKALGNAVAVPVVEWIGRRLPK